MAKIGVSIGRQDEYRFSESVWNDPGLAPVVRFFAIPGNSPDKIGRHIRNGGIAVLEGPWDEVCSTYECLMQRKKELISRRESAGYGRRDWECMYKALSCRIAVRVNGTVLAGITPKVDVPFLPGFLGESPNDNPMFVAPLGDVIQTIESIRQLYPVDALGDSLHVHRNVLVPRSQEILNLIRDGLMECKALLPMTADVEILDMGCGSGCCSFIAADVFEDYRGHVYATDHLPEAAATTALNSERLAGTGKLREGAVKVFPNGDLFDNVGGSVYDIIIFNAPWVTARARTPAETALNDENQDTVTRFLMNSGAHLKRGGRVLLGYSDNSGQKAVDRIEAVAASAGLAIENILKDRIKTRRSSRRWETIFVYRFKSCN